MVHPLYDGIIGTSENHSGTDFYAELRTPVRAMAPGKVIVVTWLPTKNGPSLDVRINHENYSLSHLLGGLFEIHTMYGHLDSAAVSEGQFVNRGDIIGYVGMSGTNWPHLHLNVGYNGRINDQPTYIARDPFAILFEGLDYAPQLDGHERMSLWTAENTPQCP